MVLLFSSERVIKAGSGYYARVINFTDFMVQLSRMSSNYHLAMLCDSQQTDQIDRSRLTEIDLQQGELLELPNLRNRYQSFFYSFYIAAKIRKYMMENKTGIKNLAVAAPGLNSVTFALSLILPKNTRWYLFIRGDTKKTVEEIYRHSLFQNLMTAIINLFQSRVSCLIRNNRGHVFVFGEALKEKFYSQYAAHTHVISPLISAGWLSSDSDTKKHNIEINRNFQVLFVGRLSPEKNIEALLQACSKARNTEHEFELTLVGDGPLEKSLRNTVQELALADIVGFTGRVSNGTELRDIYDSHDILCLPSKTEGTPRAIAEAVARGLPVVASDVGSIKHMFSNGVVYLMEGLSASDILKSLSWMFDNFQKLARKAEESRFESEKHTLLFNAEKVNQIIENDLRESARN